MAIFKRPGSKSYCYTLELGRGPDGKRRQKWQSGFRTRRLAQEAYAKAKAALDAGTYSEPSRLTVSEYLQQWLAHAKTLVSANTFRTYETLVRLHLSPALGHHRLSQLRAIQIQESYDRCPSPDLVRKQHTVLRRSLVMAQRWGLVQHRATEGVVLPAARKANTAALSRDQLSRLLTAAAGTPMLLPIALAALAGLRRGECVGLRWSDVDLPGRVLHVRRAVIAGAGVQVVTPKSGRERRVTLPELLHDLLEEHRPEGATDEPVISICGITPHPDTISDRLPAILASAGLPRVRFHDLRHSHATLLMAARIPTKVVSERIGHANPATTAMIYQHVLRDMEDEAAEAIDSAFQKESP